MTTTTTIQLSPDELREMIREVIWENNDIAHRFSIVEAMEYLNVSRSTLHKMEKRGQITPSFTTTGKKYFTSKELKKIKP